MRENAVCRCNQRLTSTRKVFPHPTSLRSATFPQGKAYGRHLKKGAGHAPPEMHCSAMQIMLRSNNSWRSQFTTRSVKSFRAQPDKFRFIRRNLFPAFSDPLPAVAQIRVLRAKRLKLCGQLLPVRVGFSLPHAASPRSARTARKLHASRKADALFVPYRNPGTCVS